MTRAPRRLVWAAALAAAVGAPLALRGCAVPLRVASLSMEPTVRQGDHVLVVKRPRRPLATGDVVAFRRAGQTWVKRVAARGGDTVEVRGGKVWVNGTPWAVAAAPILHLRAPASAALSDAWRCDVAVAGRQEGGALVVEASAEARDCLVRRGLSPVQAEAPASQVRDTSFVVPAGHLAVLGDHAPRSTDSRSFGPVPEAEVVGRVVRVLVSFNEAAGTWRRHRTFRSIR